MAMARWKTDETLDGLDGIMYLAAADSAHFADVLAAVSSNSNTNVSMMGERFKYAAPVAGALGYSIEDTALAIGLMANAGKKAAKPGRRCAAY